MTNGAERDAEEVYRDSGIITVDVPGEAIQERFDGAVGTVSTCDHEHIFIENDLHRVLGSCGASDSERT